MKKLLLALAVLVSGVVPSIAQSTERNCEQYYDLSHGEKQVIYEALFKYDLECLQYFVNNKKINIAKITKDDDANPVYYMVASDKKISLNILDFLMDQNIDITKDETSIGSMGKSTNIISYAADIVANGLTNYKNEYPLSVQKLELLLNKGGKEVWAAIHDDTINNITYADMADNKINLVKFLIDQNMPLSEYNRYIKAIEDNMAENLNQQALWANNDSKVSYYQSRYERGEEILELLTQAKEKTKQKNIGAATRELDEKIQKAADEMDE